eukprot:167953_1
MFLKDLIQKLIQFVQVNGWNLGRLIKLIGFAVFIAAFYKFVAAKPHDNIYTIPHFTRILGHLPLLPKQFSRLNEFSFEMQRDSGWPEISAATSIGQRYLVLIMDPKLVKYIFDTKFESFEKGERVATETYEILGDGIFTSDPPRWKFHRKIASRMFSMRNLKQNMFDCTVQYTDKVLNKIEEQDMNDINIYDLLSRFTLDCFTAIAFGKSVNSLECFPEKHPFAEGFDGLMASMILRHFIPYWIWKTSRFINKYSPIKFGNEGKIFKDVEAINAFSDSVLDARTQKKDKGAKQILDENGSGYDDIISLFIKSSDKQLSKDQLKFIAMNMIIAGRDTTRLLLSWFLYEMCKRPEIKKRIYNEIDAFNGDVGYSDVQKGFLYLECTLLEALRYHPVVPFLIRQAKEDVELPNGNIVRQGDEVIIPTYAYGRNPKIYDDPMTFDPNRFYNKGVLPINVKSVYEYPFFNINPRLCMGRQLAIMEAKVFVFNFFKRYEFEMSDVNQEIRPKTGIVLNMVDGLRLKIQLR